MAFGFLPFTGILMLLGGGGRLDALDLMPTDPYWQIKGVEVNVDGMLRQLPSSDAAAPDVSRHIENLGSTIPKVRDAAGEEIAAHGNAVIPQLREAADASDPEVAARATAQGRREDGQPAHRFDRGRRDRRHRRGFGTGDRDPSRAIPRRSVQPVAAGRRHGRGARGGILRPDEEVGIVMPSNDQMAILLTPGRDNLVESRALLVGLRQGGKPLEGNEPIAALVRNVAPNRIAWARGTIPRSIRDEPAFGNAFSKIAFDATQKDALVSMTLEAMGPDADRIQAFAAQMDAQLQAAKAQLQQTDGADGGRDAARRAADGVHSDRVGGPDHEGVRNLQAGPHVDRRTVDGLPGDSLMATGIRT